jgi:hemerythrin-like domain-containing protein
MSLPSDGSSAPRSRDIFELIEADHRRIQELVNQLTVKDAIPDWRPAHRRAVAQRLVIEESRHEVVEEEFFWPAVREKVDLGAELREAGLLQEQQAKRLLKSLDRAAAHPPEPEGEPEDEHFLDLVSDAARAIHEHVRFEEIQVIPALRRQLNDTMCRRLGSWYEWGIERAPTRPHPHTPPVPGILRSTGKLVAVSDKVRDFVTRRGKG